MISRQVFAFVKKDGVVMIVVTTSVLETMDYVMDMERAKNIIEKEDIVIVLRDGQVLPAV